nr:PREDICTED: pleckstrin homology domain-containing family S member 1 isoform X2 [Latimeria chalumnae]|eukprot:XP_014348100.1 PREDICTED: pleckstrin homology domain-containing family S member 1 isoform X2 [Latimeria chalumnae]
MALADSKRSSVKTVFYEKQICLEGYLLKSPPLRIISSQFSWKRRYFVLSKTNENNYILEYFKDQNQTAKSLKEINISKISNVYIRPLRHSKWEMVKKMFNCGSAEVLFIETKEREFFLIGETEEEIERWCASISSAQKEIQAKENKTTEEISKEIKSCLTSKVPTSLEKNISMNKVSSSDGKDEVEKEKAAPDFCKPRSESEPSSMYGSNKDADKLEGTLRPHSEPGPSFVQQKNIYDVPRKMLQSLKQSDDEPQVYMPMDSIIPMVKEFLNSSTPSEESNISCTDTESEKRSPVSSKEDDIFKDEVLSQSPTCNVDEQTLQYNKQKEAVPL